MIKYDNLFYILNGGDTYKFNKKLIAILGIELCALTTYLIVRIKLIYSFKLETADLCNCH